MYMGEHARVVMYMSAGTLVCVEAAKKTSEPLLATKWLMKEVAPPEKL